VAFVGLGSSDVRRHVSTDGPGQVVGHPHLLADRFSQPSQRRQPLEVGPRLDPLHGLEDLQLLVDPSLRLVVVDTTVLEDGGPDGAARLRHRHRGRASQPVERGNHRGGHREGVGRHHSHVASALERLFCISA
jgi:hypothetical protein